MTSAARAALALLLTMCVGTKATGEAAPEVARPKRDHHLEYGCSTTHLRKGLTHLFAARLNDDANEAAARDQVLNELADLNLLIQRAHRSNQAKCRATAYEILSTAVDQAFTLLGPVNSLQRARLADVMSDLAARVSSSDYAEDQLKRIKASAQPKLDGHDKLTLVGTVGTGFVLNFGVAAWLWESNHAFVIAGGVAAASLLSMMHIFERNPAPIPNFGKVVGAALSECARALSGPPDAGA